MPATNYERNKKWRKNRPEIWKEVKKRYYKRSEYTAFNARQLWTIEDCNLVLKSIYTDSELAKLIGRSVKAIQTQRVKLKERIRREITCSHWI